MCVALSGRMKSLLWASAWTLSLFLGLEGTLQAATLTLAWNPNTEPDIAGYVISYGTQPNSYTTSIDVAKTTSKQLTNLVDGTRYYFAVKAYNTSGQFSGLSTEISGVTTPSAPTEPS